ncbi:MAG: RNA ligase family protein [Clostridiales bacterium]|nr:RNA ligase family protein [Clostridiales bacterium]
MAELIKYPRTWHIEGSRLQPGDEDLSQIPFASIAGEKIVVEEKCDGANSAVSFGEDGGLLLQSRGHFLTGGYREKHFNLLKQWAIIHQKAFFDALGKRYIMYGEWMYAKHTVFYDSLPHYFLEFDIYDREARRFLDTPTRHAMLAGLPVVSVPVLRDSVFTKLGDLTDLIGQSNYIREGHMERLGAYCVKMGEDADRRCAETDPSTLMEGLYIKVERGGEVAERMKYIRASFLQCVIRSESHWLSRPIVPNQLAFPLESIFMNELSGQIGAGGSDEGRL